MTDRDAVTDDRAKRPWRYYKLDAEVLQKMCEQLADKLDASVEAKSGNNSLQNVTDRDALIARLREHAEWMKNRGAFPLMAADLAKAADALAALPPPADMNTAAEHYRQGWQAGHAAADPLPPRPTGSEPINRVDLVRYGVATPGSPTLLTPMADGYWTPWHLAAALVERTCGTCRHANFYTGSEYGMCRGDSIAIGRDITESDGCLLGWSPREDAPEDADGDD